MRDHLATLIDDFRRFDREIAVVRYQGNRRRATTYGELARLAGRFAAFLAGQGIGAGDRVLLWAENSAEWIAAFYGCLLRGVLAVPLDAAGTADFAARVAADVNPRLAVGDSLLLRKLAAAHAGSAVPTLAFENWLDQLPAAELGAVSGLSHQTPLQILFTSGTTGDPKGIVITHGNVLASVEPIEDGAKPYMRYLRIIHPLRILHTLPLSHVFGQTMGLWVPPIFTAELHFESRLAAPRLIQLIRAERVSVLAAVPRVLALLKTHLESSHADLAGRAALSQGLNPWLRWWRFRAVHREFGLKFWLFVSGGGALPGPLEQFWNALGFVLVQGYGMTETTALITLNHPFHVAKGTIGKPMPGREVKLAPDGEVLVRGPMISSATWAGGALRPREEEWLATGDIAERQESGELRFLGRKSEIIVTSSGLNIHPEDIEAVIEEQPEIAACAVVAMETPLGPEPCAVLACRGSGEHIEAAIERANARLAEFQRISRWVLWPEPDLPRTSTGKIRRKPVAAWLARVQAAASTANNGMAHTAAEGAFAPSADWLLALIAQITGEDHPAWATNCALLRTCTSTAWDACSFPRPSRIGWVLSQAAGCLKRCRRWANCAGWWPAGERQGTRDRATPADKDRPPGAPTGNKGTRKPGNGISRVRRNPPRKLRRKRERDPKRKPEPFRTRQVCRGACKSRRASTSFIPSGRGGSRSSGFVWPSLKPSCVRSRGYWPRRASSDPVSRFRRGRCIKVRY